MKSPWKVVERCEYTVIAFCVVALIVQIAVSIAGAVK